MITTHERIRILKQRAEDMSVPLKEKHNILEFFQKYNDIFYYQININQFFNELKKLSEDYINE